MASVIKVVSGEMDYPLQRIFMLQQIDSVPLLQLSFNSRMPGKKWEELLESLTFSEFDLTIEWKSNDQDQVFVIGSKLRLVNKNLIHTWEDINAMFNHSPSKRNLLAQWVSDDPILTHLTKRADGDDLNRFITNNFELKDTLLETWNSNNAGNIKFKNKKMLPEYIFPSGVPSRQFLNHILSHCSSSAFLHFDCRQSGWSIHKVSDKTLNAAEYKPFHLGGIGSKIAGLWRIKEGTGEKKVGINLNQCIAKELDEIYDDFPKKLPSDELAVMRCDVLEKDGKDLRWSTAQNFVKYDAYFEYKRAKYKQPQWSQNLAAAVGTVTEYLGENQGGTPPKITLSLENNGGDTEAYFLTPGTDIDLQQGFHMPIYSGARVLVMAPTGFSAPYKHLICLGEIREIPMSAPDSAQGENGIGPFVSFSDGFLALLRGKDGGFLKVNKDEVGLYSNKSGPSGIRLDTGKNIIIHTTSSSEPGDNAAEDTPVLDSNNIPPKEI